MMVKPARGDAGFREGSDARQVNENGFRKIIKRREFKFSTLMYVYAVTGSRLEFARER